MVIEIAEAKQLKELRVLLEESLPQSLPVLGHVVSKCLGRLDCSIFVNAWPEPSVVMVHVMKDEGGKFERYAIYTTKEEELVSFLRNNPRINWAKPSKFSVLDKRLKHIVIQEAERNGRSLTACPDYIMFFRNLQIDTNKPSRSLPSDIEITQLNPLEAEQVSKHWNYSFQGALEENRYLISAYPSVGMRKKDDGSLIGWTLTQYYWATAKAFVQPDFRNQGLFQMMIRELDSIKLKEGHMCYGYGFSRGENLASKRAMISAGYTEVPEIRYVWLTNDP